MKITRQEDLMNRYPKTVFTRNIHEPWDIEIDDSATLEEGVIIFNKTRIGADVCIKRDTTIAAGCVIEDCVTIRRCCYIGENTHLRFGCVVHRDQAIMSDSSGITLGPLVSVQTSITSDTYQRYNGLRQSIIATAKLLPIEPWYKRCTWKGVVSWMKAYTKSSQPQVI